MLIWTIIFSDKGFKWASVCNAESWVRKEFLLTELHNEGVSHQCACPIHCVCFCLCVCVCVNTLLLSVCVYLCLCFVCFRVRVFVHGCLCLFFCLFMCFFCVNECVFVRLHTHRHTYTHSRCSFLWTSWVLCNHLYKEVLVFPPKRNIGNIVAQLGDIPLLPKDRMAVDSLLSYWFPKLGHIKEPQNIHSLHNEVPILWHFCSLDPCFCNAWGWLKWALSSHSYSDYTNLYIMTLKWSNVPLIFLEVPETLLKGQSTSE